MKETTGELGAAGDTLLIYFEALQQESERGKILLLAAKIDELLCELLKTHLKPHRGKKKDEDKLFRIMGPLSSFSGRIEMAYRVGLISKTSADCFDILREIRNECAHGVGSFSFAKGSFSEKFERFKKLSYTVSGMEMALEYAERINTGQGLPSKSDRLFLLALIHMVVLQNTLLRLTRIGDSFAPMEHPDIWKSMTPPERG